MFSRPNECTSQKPSNGLWATCWPKSSERVHGSTVCLYSWVFFQYVPIDGSKKRTETKSWMLVLHKQKQSRCFLNCQASRSVACFDYIQPLEFLQILSTTLTVYFWKCFCTWNLVPSTLYLPTLEYWLHQLYFDFIRMNNHLPGRRVAGS